MLALLSRPDIKANLSAADRCTSLHVGSQEGHLDVVTALLAHPTIVVNWINKQAQTPLDWAKSNGHASTCVLLRFHSRPQLKAKAKQPSRGKKREMNVHSFTPWAFRKENHFNPATMVNVPCPTTQQQQHAPVVLELKTTSRSLTRGAIATSSPLPTPFQSATFQSFHNPTLTDDSAKYLALTDRVWTRLQDLTINDENRVFGY